MSADTSIFRADPPALDDVLIIGAGLAGLYLGLSLAPRRCTIISLAPLGKASSSAWAQGGLAAALSPVDSAEQHADDTIAAGKGLVDPTIARLIAEHGPARVRDLIELGVPFDRSEDGSLALSLEAAHTHPRVARVSGDLAGKAIIDALTTAVQASDHITVLEGYRAINLMQDDQGRATGALLLHTSGAISPHTANETVFCTGGTGGLFRVTTNPVSARGDAIAMAWQAGALVSDLEFVQFHPTAIDIGRDPAPLATEALRGEGAILINDQNDAFMKHSHPLGELAPRDDVARAIHNERAKGRTVYLDCREAVGAAFPDHFPTVFESCQKASIDPRVQPVPVAPAAHYHMGGIVSDSWGRSTLERLSVCGECASTGAHGANRLASNSLLEAVVFADRIAQRLKHSDAASLNASAGQTASVLPESVLQDLRQRMAEHCGVTRDGKTLKQLLNWIHDAKHQHPDTHPLIVAGLMARAALDRKESRGGHFRQDYPEPAAVAQRTFLDSSTSKSTKGAFV